MTTVDDSDFQNSTVVGHFEREWKVLPVAPSKTFNKAFITIDYDDDAWTTVDLPHDQIRNDSLIYWYRKRFFWRHPSDRKHKQQHIFVNFTSNESDHDDPANRIEIPAMTVWFNEVIIFEGPLGHQPIEISESLRMNALNVLVLRSKKGYSLPLYVRLVMPRVCVGQVDTDETDHQTSRRKRRVLDYTASFNDAHGRIDVFIDSSCHVEKDPNFSDDDQELERSSPEELLESRKVLETGPIPRLAVVMLIVGTRGDVQPFIALAKALLAWGHRVRLATHETFRKFVRENGIEFYPLAGDPADLMSFMVKNAGIVPSVSSIVAGDVSKSRRVIADILESTWRACIEDDDETHAPFIAEAIIANPPSYGHIHCAQKLQIPLHMMFTMPWSATAAFPHPFCKVDYDHGPTDRINRLSYGVVDMLTWTGMRDLINEFRVDILHLPSIHTRQAMTMMHEERVPHTYCWSPSLVPKPGDWSDYLRVSGFFFLDLATNYTPPDDLRRFLQAGAPPIYIGFGSITGHDSRRLLKIVLEALQATGYRALLSSLAKEDDVVPTSVFKIGNCPHDWLFQHVAAICHHGGAGTTAAGLRAGKPTIIVPFFGDQFFWGSMISKSGAGPAPIPGKDINAKDLAEAFKFVHETSTREAAERLRLAFEHEDGCQAAVQSFHSQLPLSQMRSDLEPSFPACLAVKDYHLKISRPVAHALLAAEVLQEDQLTIHSTYRWNRMKNDNEIYMPFHHFIRHGQKAFNSLFKDTAKGLKRAGESKNKIKGALDGAECVAKGVGKGIGHASVGCLSFYGDVTDTLERLPRLYDPYSASDQREQPHVTSFRSGAKAAGNSLWHGVKDGVTGLVNKPRAGFHRHGIAGVAAGAAVAIPNVVIKPVAGTLASITWLGRGVYQEARQLSHHKDAHADAQLKLTGAKGHRRSHSGSTVNLLEEEKEEDATPEGRASLASGLTVDVSRAILVEFERAKQERYRLQSSNDHSKKPTGRRFQRQRSYSSTDL